MGGNVPLPRNNGVALLKRGQRELVALGGEAGSGPIPGQQFSDEHIPPGQSKTFHCILLGPKESSKTFSVSWFRGETKVMPTGTEAIGSSETAQKKLI